MHDLDPERKTTRKKYHCYTDFGYVHGTQVRDSTPPEHASHIKSQHNTLHPIQPAAHNLTLGIFPPTRPSTHIQACASFPIFAEKRRAYTPLTQASVKSRKEENVSSATIRRRCAADTCQHELLVIAARLRLDAVGQLALVEVAEGGLALVQAVGVPVDLEILVLNG